jgi:hypothetical protein
MNLSEKLGSSDWDPETGFAHSAYPSPPSTSSNSKRSVPLPCLHADHHHDPSQELSRPSSKPFGGVLDSPIVMRHDSLGCHMPLSPPPTLPTKTQALPLEDDISLPSIPELDDSESLPLLHTLSLPRDEEPLSPISHEWATNGIPLEISPSPEHSFLLYRSCCNNFDYLLGYPTPASSSSSRPLSPPQDQLDLYSPTHGRDFSSPLYIESEIDAAISPLPLSPPESLLLKSLDLTPEDAQLPSSPFVHSLPLPGSEDDDIEDQFLHTHDSFDTQYTSLATQYLPLLLQASPFLHCLMQIYRTTFISLNLRRPNISPTHRSRAFPYSATRTTSPHRVHHRLSLSSSTHRSLRSRDAPTWISSIFAIFVRRANRPNAPHEPWRRRRWNWVDRVWVRDGRHDRRRSRRKRGNGRLDLLHIFYSFTILFFCHVLSSRCC